MVSAVMKTSLGSLKERVQAPGSVTDPEDLKDVDPSHRHVSYDVMQYTNYIIICVEASSKKVEAKKLRLVFCEEKAAWTPTLIWR